MAKNDAIKSMCGSLEVDGPVAAARRLENDAQHVLDQVVLAFEHEASKQKTLELTRTRRRLSIKTKNPGLRRRNVTASVNPFANKTYTAGRRYVKPENCDVWLQTNRIFAHKRTLPMLGPPVLLCSAVEASKSDFWSTFSRKAIICQHSNR